MIVEYFGPEYALFIQATLGLVGVIALIFICASVFKKIAVPGKNHTQIKFLGMIDTKRRAYTITLNTAPLGTAPLGTAPSSQQSDVPGVNPSSTSPTTHTFLYITSPHNDICVPIPSSALASEHILNKDNGACPS